MLKLVLAILILAAMGAVALFLERRHRARQRQRRREKDKAYVARLRAKWDEKHSESAEAFVERRRPWDGVERRKPKRPDDA